MATMVVYSDDIYHSGIKGMKWGQRRYQNEDGSLTPAGRERYRRMYGVSTREEVDSLKARRDQFKSDYKTAGSNRERRALHRSYMKDTNYKNRAKTRLAANGKRLAKGVAKTAAVGAGLAAVGLAARGMYNRRLNKAMNATDEAWKNEALRRANAAQDAWENLDRSQRSHKNVIDNWDSIQDSNRDRSIRDRMSSMLSDNADRAYRNRAATARRAAGLKGHHTSSSDLSTMSRKQDRKASKGAHTSETGSRSRSSNKYYSRKVSRKVSRQARKLANG